MPKKLYVYSSRSRVPVDDGKGRFYAELIVKKNKNQNEYFLKYGGKEIRIFSKGKRRVSMKDGVLIINQDRNWRNLVDKVLS